MSVAPARLPQIAASINRLRDLGHSSSVPFKLMKYGAWTLSETSCSWAFCLMAAQVTSVTRTDCTQPSSSVFSPIDLLNSIAPTEPPGFLGVPSGEPTVPNWKDKVMLPPVNDSECSVTSNQTISFRQTGL